MHFRKDINGLRAIAVIAVVLFHFNSSWLPGGFAGVDVFFVISGFLMTGIIFRGLEQKNFSIFNFYTARANRIIPALAILCLILLIFGWFYLTPLDYKVLGKHVARSISFVSNTTYLKEAGYFDTESHGKWLLHTWSLSVEWQFYIIFPLILTLMRKLLSLQVIKTSILVATIIGFIFCAITTNNSPESAYYLLSARVWEMLLGSIAFLYPLSLKNNTHKKLLESLGLILVIVSFFLISEDTPWPGYFALFPVTGAFLILQAQNNNSFITGNYLSQKIGAWSYSIYLWHWPLVVSIYYFSLHEYFSYLFIALSIFLGFLSYTYIEKIKFRRDILSFSAFIKSKPIVLAILVGALGSATHFTNGFSNHYPANLAAVSLEAENKNPHCKGNNKFPCYIGNKDNIKAIIVGDSHAESLATGVLPHENLIDSGVVVLKKGGCPFVLNLKRIGAGNSCYNKNLKRMKYLEENHPGVPVFWVARMGSYIYGQTNPDRIKHINHTRNSVYFTSYNENVTESLYNELKVNLSQTIDKILLTHPVYLLYPTPEMRINVPKVLSKNIMFNINLDDDLSVKYDLYLQRNKRLRLLYKEVAEINNIQTLDPVPLLCGNDRCMAQFKGRPIFFDGDHMSEYGNKLLTPMFEAVLNTH